MNKGEILSLIFCGVILLGGLAAFVSELRAGHWQAWAYLLATIFTCTRFWRAYREEREEHEKRLRAACR